MWHHIRSSSSFDNIQDAFYSLFKLTITDGWYEMMYWAIDTKRAGLALSRNASPWNALYFISFIIAGNFFALNLFIGVLADRFTRQRSKGEGYTLISPAQIKWVLAQKVILSSNIPIAPKPPKNKFRMLCFWIVESKYFEWFMLGVILVNSAILSVYFWGMPDTLRSALDWASLAIIILFTLEAIIKIVAYNPRVYSRSNWNRLDFVVVVLSWIGFAIGNGAAVVRVLRVSRLLILVREMHGLQTVFISLYQAVPELMNVSIVLAVVYFLFAIVGVELFHGIQYNAGLNSIVNFNDVSHALIALYVATTSEGWAEVVDGMTVSTGCGRHCGSSLAVPYVICFMIITTLVLMNLLVTVVIDAFSEAELEEGENAAIGVLELFRDKWIEHDTASSEYLPAGVVISILQSMPNSVWDRTSTGKASTFLCTLRQLERFYVPIDAKAMVHYDDVVASLALRLFCLSVDDGIFASQRTRYGVTWKANRFSIHHYYAAKLLTFRTRHYLNSRKERFLRKELQDLRDQHAAVVELEVRPLRRSHAQTIELTKWLLQQVAKGDSTTQISTVQRPPPQSVEIPTVEIPPMSDRPSPMSISVCSTTPTEGGDATTTLVDAEPIDE